MPGWCLVTFLPLGLDPKWEECRHLGIVPRLWTKQHWCRVVLVRDWPNCWKRTKNVAFDFLEHFPPIFVLLKVTCLVTLQVFKNSPNWTIFGIFNELLCTCFARHVDWDFFSLFSNTVTMVLNVDKPMVMEGGSRGSSRIILHHPFIFCVFFWLIIIGWKTRVFTPPHPV